MEPTVSIFLKTEQANNHKGLRGILGVESK